MTAADFDPGFGAAEDALAAAELAEREHESPQRRRRRKRPRRPRALLVMVGVAVVVGLIAWTTSGSDDSDDLAAGAPSPTTAAFDPDINFPEGYTVEQMAERVASERSGITESAFMAVADSMPAADVFQRPAGETSLEGLLFPATYPVPANADPLSIIQSMENAMGGVVAEEGLTDGATALGLTPYEVLIVASMIEKEAKVDEDRPLIARVIYNRLDVGMQLQIDATLYYGNSTDTAFSELREVDTPFNTYLNTGLPPTPIANPGRASIQAALNPAANPSLDDPICVGLPEADCRYLFYVLADSDGRHVFAATYDQHLANIEVSRAAGVL